MSSRCNGCTYTRLKHKLGDKFLSMVDKHGYTAIYELDREPYPGQTEPTTHEGRSIRWYCSLMLVAHADDCNLYGTPVEVKHG